MVVVPQGVLAGYARWHSRLVSSFPQYKKGPEEIRAFSHQEGNNEEEVPFQEIIYFGRGKNGVDSSHKRHHFKRTNMPCQKGVFKIYFNCTNCPLLLGYQV